jgi:flagellin-like hook-associated protein FlgL
VSLTNLNAQISDVPPTTPAPLSATAVIGGVSVDANSATAMASADNGFVSARAYDSTYSFIAQYVSESLTQLLGARQGSFGTAEGRLFKSPPGAAVTVAPITAADIAATTSVAVTTISATSATSVTVVYNGAVDASKTKILVASAGTATTTNGQPSFGAWALASAINHNSGSQFWAMVQSFDSNGQSADMVYVFTKEGGNYNDLLACDVGGSDSASRVALGYLDFENVANAEMFEDGTTFTLGGEYWGTMKPTQSKAYLGNEVWNLVINGRDVGDQRDIWIANANEIETPALAYGIINGMDRNSFVEIQNAADSPWAGGEVRTQSTAQESLDAITAAITAKDKIRADLGALQNRLENTMTNLTIQAENLQASESRISDVDVATEMTEFTRNNVLAQAATSMLAQANSLSQLALSLIG